MFPADFLSGKDFLQWIDVLRSDELNYLEIEVPIYRAE